MKKILIIMSFVASLFALPTIAASAAEKGKVVKAKGVTSTYAGKKDKAYWTRVWYQKQAKKGRHYKNRKKVRRKAVRKRSRVASRNVARKTRRSGRVLAKVDISSQRMNVYQGGRLVHTWKVSTGRKGYSTPTGTWTIHRMHKEYYSRKYDNAPMPYAMFYHRGFAIHGTGSIKRLGRVASHGCVRLHPSNAAKLFSMVRRSGGTVKVTY